jgi:hypothetical protein
VQPIVTHALGYTLVWPGVVAAPLHRFKGIIRKSIYEKSSTNRANSDKTEVLMEATLEAYYYNTSLLQD